MRPSTILLLSSALFAAPAAAKPPEVKGFQRIDELKLAIAGKLQELRAAEEFEKKPETEQLLIMWQKGATNFKKWRRVNGPDVVEEVFDWDAFKTEPPAEAVLRVGELLPKVLAEKYGAALKLDRDFKRERHKIGRLLVDNLVKPPLHVRKVAINCLVAMYHGGTRTYVPDDDRDKRLRAQKIWKSYVDKVKN